MKQLYIVILLLLITGRADAQKVKTYQLMEPNFNAKSIHGAISEVYYTQRFGKTFWWVKIGSDTIIHVWAKDLDTNTMKAGITRLFTSIKSLDNNWWRKEKSEKKSKSSNE
ncbi:hypothetical protein [Pedobacter nototheniae]|uniref:hypothetical protein n=1 Tax=Pedobacter nototheniae TaxID=2488994 RepID=UPI002931D2A2|nr:hypothetical protein [Pedobacter nototheniae]